MKRYNKILCGLMAIVTMTFSSCEKSAYVNPPSSVSIYEIVKQDTYNFTIMRAAIERAGLVDLLNSDGSFTFFAPTNAACTAAGLTIASVALTPKEDLVKIVQNHLISGSQLINSFSATSEKTTLGNQKIVIQKSGAGFYVDGAGVTAFDKPATNGVVHIINKLLITRTSILDVINTGANTTMLAAAITRASTGSVNFINLLNTGSFTFFAPQNTAFVDAGYATVAAVNAAPVETLVNLLRYQLIAGRKLTPDLDSVAVNAINNVPIYFDRRFTPINKSTASYANGINFSGNIIAGSGVIHNVGRFFSAPIATTTLQRITSDATLTFLAAAITRASTNTENPIDFTGILSDPKSSYTLFAPTNAAFQAKGYANLAAIQAESPQVLANLLRFHLLRYRINNISVANASGVETLLKVKNPTTGLDAPTYILVFNNLTYRVKGDGNAAEITIPAASANITTTNGLLNIVPTVLVP